MPTILVMTITKRDLSSIDTDYFDILDCNPFHITLRSKNTLHEWHLLYTDITVVHLLRSDTAIRIVILSTGTGTHPVCPQL